MKNILLLYITIASVVICHAQTFTPGTGEIYTLHDLYIYQPYVLSQGGVEDEYVLSSDLTISPNDVLNITGSETLLISPNVLLTIQGELHTDGISIEDPVTIKAEIEDSHFQGIRIEDGANVSINNTLISRGGGIKVLTTNFVMSNSIVEYQSEGASSGGAISFSRGTPTITGSTFFMNDLSAISTGANQTVGLQIIDNLFEMNSQLNENRPQINISSSGAEYTIVIEGNEIIGDRTKEMVGGIAVANFYGNPNNVQISNNLITDNRYGIAIYGSTNYALVEHNTIEHNNTQNDPMLGGSGINLYDQGDEINTNIIISNNLIRGNLWGITLQGNAFANLGDESDASPGGNVFSENGNNGATYALYNNTENNLMARQNCWIEGEEFTAEEIEEVVFHQVDDETLGFVDFANYYCDLGLASQDTSQINLYPNPCVDELNITTSEKGAIHIYNTLGKKIRTIELQEGLNRINHNLSPGVYFVCIRMGKDVKREKLIVK